MSYSLLSSWYFPLMHLLSPLRACNRAWLTPESQISSCLCLSFFSSFTTFLTFYFVSAVLFSLLCSPFSSHFLFQKLLSKSLLSFSQLINLPFTFSSPHLSTSTCPRGIFMKQSHMSFRKAAGRACLREEEWRPWSVWLGARGVSALLGNQFSYLSYTTPSHSAFFLPVSCRHTLCFT